MIAELERTHCKPSGYPEYDNMSGYLERRYSVEWEDAQGTLWRKTCTVINLGRPDRGTPVNPDEAMETDDGLFRDEHSQMADAWKARREQKIANDAILVERLRAAYAKHGPMTSSRIAGKVHLKQARVAELLRSRPDLFQFFGGFDRAWGLLDQEYTPVAKKKVTQLMLDIRGLLLERGPMTSPAIADVLGKYPTSVHNSLKNHGDWFVGVGTQPIQGNRPATRIWGLAGVHDAR